MVEQKTKVRLLFFLCPDLDVEACTHLLLSQNRFQSNFEFERPPFEAWPDAEQRMAALRNLEPGGKKELVKAVPGGDRRVRLSASAGPSAGDKTVTRKELLF